MTRRGFTIVELIIVITIIGILLTLAVVGLNGTQAKARDDERETDINALGVQLESYYSTGTPPAEHLAVTSGLVGWWRLDGNAQDAVGAANGTVSGATLTSGKNGASNSAYHFDGVNDYIELPPIIANYNSFSVSVWARGVSSPNAADGHSYIVHDSPTNYMGSSAYWIATRNGIYAGDVSGDVSSSSTTLGNASIWRFITLTYNGTTRNVYVDGNLQSSQARSFTNSTVGTRVGIGGTPNNSTYRPFLGDIDDVRIYSRPLSAAEVKTLYQAGAGSPVRSGGYPSTLLTQPATLQQYLPDLNEDSVIAPGESQVSDTFIPATNNIQTAAGVIPQPTISQYVYQPIDSSGNLCVGADCRKFNLYYRLESDNTVYKYESRNR